MAIEYIQFYTISIYKAIINNRIMGAPNAVVGVPNAVFAASAIFNSQLSTFN
jgi:hypothetical protein